MKLNAVKCDWCKKIYYEDEWDGYKFWHVDMGGTHFERSMHDQWSFDFCSENCLMKWIANFIDKKEVCKHG